MPHRLGLQLGNYRLLTLLGKGGFAQVYLGEHIHLGTKAAIKVLHTYNQLTKEEIEKFRIEAQMIAHLSHPNIVHILDFGIEEDTSTPFLVMDYAPNGTLRQRHPGGTILSLKDILPYVKQVSEALQYAHNQKLVHRDIKPENMLLTNDNKILLSDFGIAVIAHSTASQITEDVIGTIGYMSPEQIQGKPRSASDQYSLGVVIYEWLCGTWPFNGSPNEIVLQHLNALPPPLHEKIPSITPEVENVVLKALAKDFQQRFETIEAFSNALEQAFILQETDIAGSEGSILSGDSSTHPISILPTLGTTLATYQGLNRLEAVVWSPDGLLIAAGDTVGTVYVWSVATGQEVYRFKGHRSVNSLSWSPDSTRLASAGSEGTMQEWDIIKKHKVFSHRGHTASVNVVRWSPDGKQIATGSSDKTAIVWDAGTGKNTLTYQLHTEEVLALDWSPNSKLIASGSADRTVQIWAAYKGREHFTYYNSTGPIEDVGWSSDGKYIASVSSYHPFEIWQWSTGILHSTYKLNQQYNQFKVLAWASNGELIALGGVNKEVSIWDINASSVVFTYSNQADKVSSISWSPDGTRIASASYDGTVHVWQAK